MISDRDGKVRAIQLIDCLLYTSQNMKKDYTQINPVIAEAYDLIQKAAARTDGLSGLESGYTKLDKICLLYTSVVQDMLGMNNGFRPRFLRRYADLHTCLLYTSPGKHTDVLPGQCIHIRRHLIYIPG